jgi:hypothetical protein
VASTAEDIVAIGSVILAAFAPLILFIVVAIGVIVSLIVLPKIIRYLRGIFGRTREKAKAAKPM